MKRLVLIETLHTGTGLEVIKSALNKNIELCFVTAEKWIYKNCPIELLESIKIIEVDWSITDVRTEFVKLRNGAKDVALFTQRDGFVEEVANICEEFDINFQSSSAIKLGRNKELTRNILLEKLASSPAYYHVCSHEDLESALIELDFPIIAKPADGSGSKGVIMLNNGTDAQQLHSALSSNNPNILLEEFKVGELVSVETFTYQGNNHFLGCTNRLMTPHPNFIELGYSFPYELTPVLQDLIESYTNTILNTIDYKFGFCHIEYIVGKDDVYLVEVNPRLGGGQLGNLMSESLQFNIYDMIVDALFNKLDPNFSFTKGGAFGCYTVYPAEAGKVKNITGLDITIKHPGVINVIQGISIGDYVSPPSDMLGHAFQVIARGETAERALLTAYSASTSVSIEIESGMQK